MGSGAHLFNATRSASENPCSCGFCSVNVRESERWCSEGSNRCTLPSVEHSRETADSTARLSGSAGRIRRKTCAANWPSTCSNWRTGRARQSPASVPTDGGSGGGGSGGGGSGGGPAEDDAGAGDSSVAVSGEPAARRRFAGGGLFAGSLSLWLSLSP